MKDKPLRFTKDDRIIQIESWIIDTYIEIGFINSDGKLCQEDDFTLDELTQVNNYINELK